MKDFLTAAATTIIGVWLFILLIGLFWTPYVPDYKIESCCWVVDQFGWRHYIGPEPRMILGIPIREDKLWYTEQRRNIRLEHRISGLRGTITR